MSRYKGSVGQMNVELLSVPQGVEGKIRARLNGEEVEVHYRRDAQGLMVEFPHGVFEFDFNGEWDEGLGKRVYTTRLRNADAFQGPYRFQSSEEKAVAGGASGAKRAIKVKAQMPGKIVKLLVQVGDTITKDQPLLVMEAMKMENEIRAAAAGTVELIGVEAGQAVETGAELIRIQ